MLTKLKLRNFKRFTHVEIDLGSVVVFIGPNNSGKTSALQALALWELGLRKWNEKRSDRPAPEKRPGVTINRQDLVAIPVPDANLLWRDLHVREVQRIEGKQKTENVRIDIIVDGVTEDAAWSCGFEFDYANEESFYCRPLRLEDGEKGGRMPVPEGARGVRVAFLPPMSGLSAAEDRLDPGAVAVRIGEGRTAEVLRNLCHRLSEGDAGRAEWEKLAGRLKGLFGVTIERPTYIPERGAVKMTYSDRGGTRLDLSSAGRGLHQTLLLLSYMAVNPGSVLLLDEPDAHLEILRQRQTYHLLTRVARETGSQIVAASHSEVVLNEAADRDVVVAYVGEPHRIDDRGSQVLKALRQIGFEHYYQAETQGAVLYLEGSTDLAILQAFAETLRHPAQGVLERPFVHYVGNVPQLAREHFYGLREAKKDLVGLALFDRIDKEIENAGDLRESMWTRCEIENYLCFPEVLEGYAMALGDPAIPGPLFAAALREERVEAMRALVRDLVPPLALRDASDRWWIDTKVTDDFLDRLFELWFQRLRLPNLMRKSDYHELARLVPPDRVDPEVVEKLDAIVEVHRRARPRATD